MQVSPGCLDCLCYCLSVEGDVIGRYRTEDSYAVLDYTENELESVDYIPVFQCELHSIPGWCHTVLYNTVHI